MTAEYTPEQRRRNQLSILLSTAAVVAVVAISGTLQSWGVGSFVVALVVILGIAAIVWKLFASGDARPLPTDRDHARWPYLSKKTMDEIKKHGS